MIIEWKKSESTEIPSEIDIISSKTTVYLRKNIVEKTIYDKISGESVTYYEYEELKLTKEEYEEYKQLSEMINSRQMRADLDYIALCIGIDLEV